MRGDQRGQASVEWIGLVLLVGCVLAGLLTAAPSVGGRPLGAAIARVFVCAVKRDCGAGHAALARAYGDHDADLVRENAPNIVYERRTLTLPIDWRRCRSHRCSDAPDDPDLDATHGKRGGAPATAFTHVVKRGGRTYIQYWFYYPDSPSTFMGSHAILGLLGIRDPAFHLDDWEGYQVRIDRDGSRWSRATSHKGYQWCKQARCKNEWGPDTGWTRVSYGSHAGHIPLKPAHERVTTASDLGLVPIETLDTHAFHPRAKGISPPWQKRVYTDPESKHT